ncbi:SDR family oxidoreductase [Sphingomonas sp. SUN019]|uniref:SDR family NAD(P)-dependent oxidoreductase n=1 Tax=Sphingomonas sp. SUN019 TaxID=2937788 RepID=UPI00216484A9|nr:SDR family NAD(P)-dependent oxidoreductase [Sphingomonas sp. SUN019]UVO51767.1 SDR family oxidoreductase [Sphingomonas sp. SUN019]
MSGLAGRVALVTGGGRGIGRAIALRLARDGADVAVNYRRDADAAAEVVAEIVGMGRTARAYAASVDRFEECEALVAAVLADFGAVDILVNNAGIASRGQSVANTEPGELERVLKTHAFAPHYMSKLVLPSMRERASREGGRGDIVMISSVATLYHAPNGAPYNMGKAAVEALAQTLAKEERAHGIRTNIVAPGLTVTDMGERLAKATRGVASIHDLDAGSPFGRVSTPEDVAAAVAYFVSADGAYANGQKINLHGGG